VDELCRHLREALRLTNTEIEQYVSVVDAARASRLHDLKEAIEAALLAAWQVPPPAKEKE
jgi:hypothetical protein